MKPTKNKRNIFILSALIILALLVFSNINNNVEKHQKALETDKLQINGIVAVFLGPNEAEVNKMNSEGGEGLDEYVSDSQYYQGMAWKFLGQHNIKTIFTTYRYLEFTKDSGEVILIDRNSIDLNDWGILLFDGKQDPFKVDMTVIETEYEKYFNS